MLGLAGSTSDAIYSLWLAESLGWRPALPHARQVTRSENGAFTAHPRLVVSPDGRLLLIRRGGIWADCFDMGPELRPCSALPRNSRRSFPERSEEIARLLQSHE